MAKLVNTVDGTVVEEPAAKPWPIKTVEYIRQCLLKGQKFSVIIGGGSTFSIKEPYNWRLEI